MFAEFLRARHQTEPRNTPGNNSDPKRCSGSPHHPLLCPRDYIAFVSAVPLSHAHAAAPISARCSAAVRPPLEHRSARRCVFGCAFGRLGGAVSLQVHAGRFCALPLLSVHCRCPTAAEEDRRRGETARRGCRCTAGEPGCWGVRTLCALILQQLHRRLFVLLRHLLYVWDTTANVSPGVSPLIKNTQTLGKEELRSVNQDHRVKLHNSDK